jgi:catalase (peroxidase I)
LALLSRAEDRVEADSINYAAVKKDIAALLEKEGYDDGSYGPVLVRLAWHAAGTYDKVTGTGGSDGATMRFCPEKHHGANAGLQVARDLLEPIKAKYPVLSYADLWTLAGVTAIEEANGPVIPWRPGRSDKPDGSFCPPDGRLPDASKGADHIRAIFYRMGFNDQEIVALVGAHAMGRCHPDRSGFSGPWTKSPTMFSNDFFIELVSQKWTPKQWSGPMQYQDASGELMMLPADLAFLQDPAFRHWVEIYAKDEDRFFADFARAFSRLLELGCKQLRTPIPH